MSNQHVVLSAPSKCCEHVEFLDHIAASDVRRTAVVTREDDGGGVAVRVWVLSADTGAQRVTGADGNGKGPVGADLRVRGESTRIPLAPNTAYCLWGRNPSAGRTSRVRLDVRDE